MRSASTPATLTGLLPGRRACSQRLASGPGEIISGRNAWRDSPTVSPEHTTCGTTTKFWHRCREQFSDGYSPTSPCHRAVWVGMGGCRTFDIGQAVHHHAFRGGGNDDLGPRRGVIIGTIVNPPDSPWPQELFSASAVPADSPDPRTRRRSTWHGFAIDHARIAFTGPISVVGDQRLRSICTATRPIEPGLTWAPASFFDPRDGNRVAR